MSLIHRARTLGRHRAKTSTELRAVLDSADCLIIGLTTEIDQLTAERSQLEGQLDQAGIDYSGALDDLRVTRGHLTQAEQVGRDQAQEIAELKRRIQIGIDAEHVIARTQEMDVAAVQEWFEHGRVRRLGAVTNPAASSSETTQSLRVVQGVA